MKQRRCHGSKRKRGRGYQIRWFDGSEHLIQVEDEHGLRRVLHALAAKPRVQRWEFQQLGR